MLFDLRRHRRSGHAQNLPGPVCTVPKRPAQATDEEVKIAATNAQCSDFIEKLEYGYDTVVGNAGAKLSGGQRQRIVIGNTSLFFNKKELLPAARSASSRL